jgi:hypothetical protein
MAYPTALHLFWFGIRTWSLFISGQVEVDEPCPVSEAVLSGQFTAECKFNRLERLCDGKNKLILHF